MQKKQKTITLGHSGMVDTHTPMEKVVDAIIIFFMALVAFASVVPSTYYTLFSAAFSLL